MLFQVLFYYYPQGGPPKVAGSLLMDDIRFVSDAMYPPLLGVILNGSTLDFHWTSRPGRQYDLESTVSPIATNWAAYNGYTNMAGTPTGTNTLSGVAMDGAERFFRVLEKD